MFYILHYQKCHHEWPSSEMSEKCDWCGADSYILGEDKSWDWEKILECLKKMKRKINNENKNK